MPQPSGGAFAEFLSSLAYHDYALAAVLGGPAGDGSVVATQRAWQQPWIGAIVVIDAHVDGSRCVRQADEAGKLRYGDESGCGHGVPFPYSGVWTRSFSRSLTG